MQAKVQIRGEVTIVELKGRVDIEVTEAFRKQCLGALMGRKVVFDLSGLNFVGSTGILPFLESMQDFAIKNPHAYKLCQVGSEFKKIFLATSLSHIEIFENVDMAAHAYQLPVNQEALVAKMAPLQKDGSIFHDHGAVDIENTENETVEMSTGMNSEMSVPTNNIQETNFLKSDLK